MDAPRIARLGLVVHPGREIGRALDSIQRWSEEHDVDVVQVASPGDYPPVVEPGAPGECGAIAALGGDGTTLAALRIGAEHGKPVMGVACGRLGALMAVTVDDLDSALDRLAAGDWTERRLPALALGDPPLTAVNDVIIVRQGASQIVTQVMLDGELFVRFAGDGLVIATQLGSSAYTLAAGGPLLAPGGSGMVFTPVSPHGGCCPGLVAGPDSRLSIELHPGHGGARIELDGQVHDRVEPHATRTFDVVLRRDHATLVAFGGEEPMLAGLRRRRVIIDSARILARGDREAAGLGF
jgi:NAD+ kinase